MYSKKEIEFIKEFINDRPDAKIFLGADSQRLKKKRTKFATVIIVHYIDENGQGKGAKIFTDVTYEKIIDAKLNRPFNRMMTEVNKLTEVYTLLEDVLIDREFEIHLDISEQKEHGSNVAHGYAKGMIYGTIGVEPIFKPNAFAASSCADRYSK